MKLEKLPKGIIALAIIEIAIGLATLSAVTTSLIVNLNTKPPNILAFVFITSLLSFGLGIGLLKLNKQAYELLLFLAGVVILTKILIFTNIIQLNGSLETKIPSTLKNYISVIYHVVIWCYLNRKSVKALFVK